MSTVVFGATLYFSNYNLPLALFATLRVWDTMSDWAMWAITLQNDRFTKFSEYGTDGDNTFKRIQIASLVFTILGNVLLLFDLATLLRRFSSDASDSGVGPTMCGIVFLEDIPQLVIAIMYLISVDGFVGVDSDDALAVASLVLSIISLLINGFLGGVYLLCDDK